MKAPTAKWVSEADPFLPVDARDRRPFGLPARDVLQLRAEAEAILSMGYGVKGPALDRLAERYGVNRRTVYRYLLGKIEPRALDGWEALFLLETRRPPRRVSEWRRV